MLRHSIFLSMNEKKNAIQNDKFCRNKKTIFFGFQMQNSLDSSFINKSDKFSVYVYVFFFNSKY